MAVGTAVTYESVGKCEMFVSIAHRIHVRCGQYLCTRPAPPALRLWYMILITTKLLIGEHSLFTLLVSAQTGDSPGGTGREGVKGV